VKAKSPKEKKAAKSSVTRPKRVIPEKKVTKPTTPKKKATPKKSPKKASPKKVAAPKKRTTTKKTKTAKDRKTHPTYERMIIKALNEIGKRGGNSGISIANYIHTNYPVSENYKNYVRHALNKGEEAGYFVRVGRFTFRLSPKAKTLSTARKSKSPRKKRSDASSTEVTKKTRAPKKTTKESPKKSSKSKTSKKESPKKATKKSRKASTAVESPASETTGSIQPKFVRPSGLKSDYLWQYDHNGWNNYTAEASDIVEDVYQKYLANRGDTDVRAVHSGQWEYMVDFMAMKQTNIQHENHTTRSIRRVKVD